MEEDIFEDMEVTSYDLDKPIHHLFEEQVKVSGDLPCVIFQEKKLTYMEVDERSNILAWHLQNLGIKSGDYIAVALKRSENLVVAILAILKLDCIYVPIDLSNPLGRLQFIFGDAEPRLAIATVDSEDFLRTCFSGEILFITEEIFSVHEENALSSVERISNGSFFGENIAYVIYTSGSTGNPKGVCCTHKGLVNRICWMRDHYQIGSNDKVLQKTPIGFDVSLWEFFLPLISGACLIVAAPEAHRDNQAILDLVRRENVTVIHFVPSMFRAFLQSSDSFDSCVSLRYIFSSGEALGLDIAKLFFDKFAKFRNAITLHNLYGPTEAAIDVSFYDCCPEVVDSMESATIPIGKPIVNTQLYILDEYLKPVSPLIPGELFIGGVGLAKEYLKRRDLTQEYFLPNPFGSGRIYRTGDIVIGKCDGNIEFLGRKDTQVKIRGFRIELGEIEMSLMKIPGVLNAAVIVREDLVVNSKVLVGYIQKNINDERFSSEKEDSFVEMLQENLNNNLPSYMIPTKYVFLDQFPLTLSGKLDRKALPKPVTKTDSQVNHSHQSRTEMENKLMKIWCQVMGFDQLGLRDNFFQIGGDSIISMQIRSRAKDFGVLLSVRDIFDYPTIQQLSVILDRRSKDKNAQSKQNDFICESFGEIPLLPVQQWFFRQNFENINFWNQYILVKPNVRIEQDVLFKSLEVLQKIHVILNVRFEKVEENGRVIWVQNCSKGTDTFNSFVFIVNDMNDDKFKSEDQKLIAMQECRIEAEKLINIQSGVLWGVILYEFNCDKSIDQRVLFFAHHLLMDGVSLRIIISDLENVYRDTLLGNDNTLEIGRTSTSFRNWSLILADFAQNMEFSTEIGYWENCFQSSKDFSLPLENLPLAAGEAIHKIAINEQITYDLIHKCNSAYRTEINDILLTAFVLVISEWTGKQRVLLELEGHGREEEIQNGNSAVDLTKTVGWFTSMFPVCLCIENPSDLGQSLKLIKEQLRKIPLRGIHYGILKYLKNYEFVNGDAKEPDICFNYLGQFDNVQKSNHWSVLKSEDSISKENHLHKSIIVDSAVCEGILEISWRYKNCIALSIIENLSKMYARKLEEVVNHCCNEQSYGYSPSDFPLLKNNLDQEAIDENFGKLPGIVDIVTLSPMQLGMYFQNCLDPNTDKYLVQKLYEIKGDLNVEIFEESWKKIISHFDILRTGCKMIDSLGIPVQYVLSSVPNNFKYLDWSLMEKVDKNALFRKYAIEDRRNYFSLNTPPLMRIMLVKISPDHFLLIWSMHHLILDGWSTEILFQSLRSCYGQLLSGRIPEILNPSSFREYLSWIASPQRENQKVHDYFANYLQEYLPKENLTGLFAPLTRRQSQIANSLTFEFDNAYCKIQENLLTKLKERASSYQVTLSTVIEFAWGTILSRFTGEQDIVFGLTISGRSEHQNHDIVGLLINTLPVRIQFNDNNDDIHGQLTKLQTDIRKLEEFSHISLAEIQSTSLKYVRTSGSDIESLFDTILIFENYPVDSIKENGFEITCTETIETTEYPLTVSVTLLENEELGISINYKKKYFLSNHIQNILHSFHTLLEDIVASPGKSWKELNILSDDNKKDFSTTWQGGKLNLEEFSTVIGLIFENVERMPNSIAIINGDRKVTYKELFERANDISTYLESLLVELKGKPFAIIMDRSAELIFAIISVFLVGGVYIPVDPSTPESRMRFILDDTQAICVLTVKSLRKKFEKFKGHVICVDECFGGGNGSMISSQKISERIPDNVYIIYTSGSTGNPKGCLVNHENLKNYLLWARKQYCNPESSGENHLIPLHSSISFDLSITSILLPLISCQTVLIVPDALGVVGLLDTLRTYREFSLLKLTPSHLDIIYEAFPEPGSLPKVQCLVIGGENLLTSQIFRWRLEQPETKIFNEYGPTECTVGCTAFEVNSVDESCHSVPIGSPITNTSIYVLDKRLNMVPKYVLGELYVGGKGVTNGYLNLPEKTKDNFIKNPFGDGLLYRTGDTVRYCDNSILEYLGRSDRQIKLRGYRIELGEIEFIIRNALSSISEVAVVVVENELNAFVVSKGRVSKEDIILQLEQRLPKYMIPSKIEFLENLPITSSGKVDILALQKFHPSESPPIDFQQTAEVIYNSEIVPMLSELETQLALIWREVLDINGNIANEDNFFQLGGHSLTALRFVHLSKTRLGISFPLSKIFEIPTVKELAFYIEKFNCPIQSLKHLPQGIVTVNGQGPKTPVFLVHSGFGFATEYLSLAELDTNRPIYGINSRRFSTEFSNASEYDENTLGFRNIEEMATCYVEDILSVRSDGPFIVGGWSFGGVIAVEIAHILKQKGKEVALVLLLDSFNNKKKSDMEKGNADIEANFPTLSADEKSLIYRELESNCNLLRNHVVKPIPDQQVVLIKAKKSDDSDIIDDHNGWGGIIPKLKVINISASHYDMFQPNCIKDTLIALQKALENVK